MPHREFPGLFRPGNSLRWRAMTTEKSAAVPYLDLVAQMRPLRKEIDAAIARTLDNCSFCLGPDVAQFEKDFARYCGAEHCVAFNSGTSALHIGLMLLNVGRGDEVITYAVHFCSHKLGYFLRRRQAGVCGRRGFHVQPEPGLVEKSDYAQNQGNHAGASLRASG